MIINAENLVVGRIATVAAKRALLGEKVDIINCEKAVITGSRADIFKKFKAKLDRGIPLKGPYYPKRADMMVRRMVRGMLPYKKERGARAYKRIMCYLGTPEDFKDKKPETIKEAKVTKLSNLKFITIGELSKHLGARI